MLNGSSSLKSSYIVINLYSLTASDNLIPIYCILRSDLLAHLFILRKYSPYTSYLNTYCLPANSTLSSSIPFHAPLITKHKIKPYVLFSLISIAQIPASHFTSCLRSHSQYFIYTHFSNLLPRERTRVEALKCIQRVRNRRSAPPYPSRPHSTAR